MKASFPSLAATIALVSSGCKDRSPQERSDLDRDSSNSPSVAITPPQTAVRGSDPRTAAALKAVPRTALEIDTIAQLQQSSFLKTGEWIPAGAETAYENRLLNAISQDLLNAPFVDSPGAIDKLFEAVNRAGYHLYLSGTVLNEQPYLTVVLYALGEPKQSHEFDTVKRMLNFNDKASSMRELIKLVATPHGDELYGSVSKTGDVLVSPWGISRDLFAEHRDPKVIFQAVLANEVGHLKLFEARKRGDLTVNEHSLDEAYSDYCTFLITPENETVFALFDVLASTSQRYETSKTCARTGLENFGRQNVPGFKGLADESSKNTLIDTITQRATPRICEKLKREIVDSYKQALMEKGFPSALF